MMALASRLTVRQFTALVHAIGACLLLTLGAAGGYLLVARPFQTETAATPETPAQLRARESRTASRLKELTERVTRTQAAVLALEARLASGPATDQFLHQLDVAARAQRVEIYDYRPAGAQTADKFLVVPVQLSMKGSYGDVCRFFARLETMERLNRVRAVRMAPGDAGGMNFTVTLTLELFADPSRQIATAPGDPTHG